MDNLLKLRIKHQSWNMRCADFRFLGDFYYENSSY